MSKFKINLAQEYTTGQQKRRRSYWLMMTYFSLCGLLLINTAYQAVQTVIDIQSKKAELAALNQRFQSKYPKERSITEWVDQSIATLKRQEGKIDLLLKETQASTPLGECLYRFADSLPTDMKLAQFSLDPNLTENQLLISFYLPAKRSSEMDPLQWVTKWKKDDNISKLFTDLTLADRKDHVEVENQMMTKFTCTAEYRNGVIK